MRLSSLVYFNTGGAPGGRCERQTGSVYIVQMSEWRALNYESAISVGDA